MTDPALERLTLGDLTPPDSPLRFGEGVGGEVRSYRARFVRAGRPKCLDGSPAPWTITPEALETAALGGLFDDKPVFLNHASFLDAPSLGNLVGRTGSGAAYNSLDQSIEGQITLLPTPAGQIAATIINDILASPGPDIGLSIVFYPVWSARPPYPPLPVGEAAGGEVRTLTAIRHVESVDLVFQPAADGRILHALSSGATLSSGAAISPISLSIQGEPNPMTAPNPNPEPPVAADLHDLRVGPSSAPAPDPFALTASNELPSPLGRGAGGEVSSPASAWTAALAQSAASMILANSGLPDAARLRLASRSYTTPAELQSAIEAERLYLASLAQDSVIHIGGTPPRGSDITGMRTSLDRVALAFEALVLGGRPPEDIQPLSGIRELYHLLSGDYEMTGIFQSDRVALSNVNSSTMANMVANVLNKRVAQEFITYPMWWQPIVLEEDFQSLQQIKWITLGGIGELPTVAEGAAYTELNWDDNAETASFVKKGGYLGLTIEAIDKDDTARLRSAPRALAQAAWLTLSKAVSNVFTQSSGVGPTLADSKALFHTDHANLGATALSITSFNAARTAMRKQTELNSGERLGALTSPRFLLVPPDLEITALQVLASDYDYTYALSNAQAAPVNTNARGDTFEARMNAARARVLVVDLWTDTNDWAAVADPRLFSTLGVGYRYGRSPEIFSVASPTAGLMFTNDTMPIKARFFFAVAPIDYRGLYKANVA